jgi:ABC-type glycerol-3-phosphate transport system permease component
MYRFVRRNGLPQQLILLFLAVLTLYPFYFMLMTSLKDNEQFYKEFWTPALPFHFENYSRIFPLIADFIGNSILYSVPTLLLVAALALLTGYAFARYQFRGREALFLTMLALMMLPGVLTLIPLFIQLRDWKWLNTPHGVIIPWVAFQLVFSTFVMRTFFEKLPKEVFEAARLDGAGELGLLWHVAVPLALPGLGTITIINVLFTWNDIIWPLVTLFDRDKLPIAAGMIAFRGEYRTDFGPLFAGYTLACVPVIVLFVFTIRRFIRGLEGGLSL